MRFFRIKFILAVFFIFQLSTYAYAEPESSTDSNPSTNILISPNEKLNLVGFIPPEKSGTKYTLKTVGNSQEIIQSLAEGKELLGFLSPLDVLRARSQQIPLVVVASPFQMTPIAFAYKKNILKRSFEDFKGKTVLFEPGSQGEVLFRGFLRRVKILPEEMVWLPRDPSHDKGFGDADIVILDTISEVLQFSKNPETERILYPYEFGVYFKGALLVTSEKSLSQHRDLIRFLTQQTIKIFLRNLFDSRNLYKVILEKTIPYVYQNNESIGKIDNKDWFEMERVLLEEGFLSAPLLPDSLSVNVLTPIEKSFDFIIAVPGLPSADFSGFYMAQDKGYYRQSYVTTKLHHLASESEVIRAVREGKAVLGVASAVNLLRAQSENPDLVVLGVIYQKDPGTIITLTGNEGKEPKEIFKKTFLVNEGDYGTVLSGANAAGLKWKDVTANLGTPSFFALLDRRAEAIVGRPVYGDYRLEPFKDFFIPIEGTREGIVGLTLFTTQKQYEGKKNLIKNVLKSTYHGFENTVFQTELAAQAVLQRDESLSFKDLKLILKANAQFIKDSHGVVGTVDTTRWQDLVKICMDSGFISKSLDLKSLIPEESQKSS